jgi:hypothetical protein
MSFSISPAVPNPPAPVEPVRKIPVSEPEPSLMLNKPIQLAYPTRYEIPTVAEQPYVIMDPGSPAAALPAPPDRFLYVVDPYQNTAGYVKVSEPADPRMNVYRVSRDEKKVPEEAGGEPVLLYAISKNGKTGKSVKKVFLDPDNGLVVSQTSGDSTTSSLRKKRSADEAKDVDGEPDGADGHAEEVKDPADPNGHSHSGNDQVK